MHGMRPFHPRSVHPQGFGQQLALKVPEMRPLQRVAQRQVFRQGERGLLQGRLFPVSHELAFSQKECSNSAS